MASPTVTGADAIAALDNPLLVPPPRPPQLADGATADLRESMARFSNPTDHPPRRTALIVARDRIDLAEVERIAAAVMSERLDGTDVDIVAASWQVPSYVLATILGFGEQSEQIRADVEQVARVIGRNEPSGADSDAATERLLAMFGAHPDPVAVVSLLYQNHDATSGLTRTTILSAYTGSPTIIPGKTVRVATSSTTAGQTSIDEGETVAIDLAGMPFGSGPHRCPGEYLATAVATGIRRALVERRYTFRASLVEVDPHGVPIRFVMEAPPSARRT